jgi:predicted porin
MKKSLVTLAVLGAFGAAASTAFAQTNVSIYGIVDAGLSRTDTGAATVTSLDSGIQSGSRVGFRGTEDLGGGLSAIFTLENGFNADTGALGQGGRLFGRQAFVGLSGNFGALKLGRQNNPIRPVVEAVDPFGIGLAGNATNVFNVYGDRADNTINYSTPNWGGFSGQLAYSLGEVAGSTSTGRQIGANAGYANGPITAAIAYHNQNLATATGTDNGNAKTTLLAGTYDFGVAKGHLAYAWNKGNSAAGADTIDSRDLLVGGAGSFLASYQRKNNKLIGSADSNVWALGYTHNVSKRTNFYTSYAKIRNDAAATVGFGGAVIAGNDPSTFNVGVRHKF